MLNSLLSESERSALSQINGADVRPARFWLLRTQIALTMALFWIALMLFRSDLVCAGLAQIPKIQQKCCRQ